MIHYCFQMYLKILKVNVLKDMNLILLIFICNWLSMASLFKMTGIKLELLTDNDMLMIVEKRTRGGICHAVQRYSKANNKYMKNYNKNIESSYVMYLDANNLYGGANSSKVTCKWF